MDTESDILNSEGEANLLKYASLNAFAGKIYASNPGNQTKVVMDITSPEVLRFLKLLHQKKVFYMLVGGVATTFHGHIRTTQDIDLWVKEGDDNKKRLINVLLEMNVPGAERLENIPLIAGWSQVSVGDQGFVVDFMKDLKRFSSDDFDYCYSRSREATFENIQIRVIHLDDLINEKKSSGRVKDLEDVKQLERLKNSR